MKVVIYDTRHYEMVNVLFRIFNLTNYHILFLVSESIHQKLIAVSGNDLNHHSFLVQKNSEPSADFFQRCNSTLKDFDADFLILNTIDKDYKEVWHFVKHIKKSIFITIHNVNTWLNPPFTLNRIALKNYYFRKKIIARSDSLILLEDDFGPYITKHTSYKKSILFIPYTLKEFSREEIKNEKIIISIPGSIDGVRRDINLVLDVIEEVHKKSDRFRFVFLGNVIGYLGKPIWERAAQLQQSGVDIHKYYDATSNKTFDDQMKKCDIVLLPLNVNTKFEGIPEIYGTTKVTGVTYDMMRFSKPGIVPIEMSIPTTMKGSLLTYQGKAELTELILSLENNKDKLTDLNRIAETNSHYYTVEEIRKRVLPKIQEILLFLKS